MCEIGYGLINIGFGWILGLLSISFANDAQAAEKCRQTSFDLKNLLEKCAEQLRNPGRSNQQDLEILFEIKKIIEKLSVEKAGLTFQSRSLNNLIYASYQLFDRLQLRDQNNANEPHFIASELLADWEIDNTRPLKAKGLIKIQMFLHSSQLRRFMKWATWSS
jgi:hypothetical protein